MEGEVYTGRVVRIFGVELWERKDCEYAFDYWWLAGEIASGALPEVDTWRAVIRHDLWFIVYFVLGVKPANHPFVVSACKEVQQGPRTHTADVWARGHFKTTSISISETLQRIALNREERICIFSYALKPAKSIFRAVKQTLEISQALKVCYDDVFFSDPEKEAYKWSEDDGLYVKRDGIYREPTLKCAGLIEGMPTGDHYTGRVYDDVVTLDLVNTPDIMEKVKEAFDMSLNLGTGTEADWERVIGTYYDYDDPLVYITGKKNIDGTPAYTLRKKPATDDGTINGKPVFFSQEKLDKLKGNLAQFNTQYLCDPSPTGQETLNPDLLQPIPPERIPTHLYRVMTVDPAGTKKGRPGDAWGGFVVGVSPNFDDLGASSWYIIDAILSPYKDEEAWPALVNLYMRGGRIRTIGVEKVGISSAELWLKNALKAKGILISEESGTLTILHPGKEAKQSRIRNALCWPLRNGKIFYSTAIPRTVIERLKMEMQRFPHWHDDGLDCLAYVPELLKDRPFSAYREEVKEDEIPWWLRKYRRSDDQGYTKDGWRYV